MHVEWYGQSAFRLQHDASTVAIDPFGDMSAARMRGLQFDYPPIEGLEADLLLVTHEHSDHNAVDRVGGDPVIVRSTAGRHATPVGDVVGVAGEHDEVAGSERGPNTMYAFGFGDVRVAHLGDLGQSALRDAQLAALGRIDLLFVPIGGGPTIGAERAHEAATQLGARWVVPMHYGTRRVDFLEPADAFLARFERIAQLEQTGFTLEELPTGDGPLVVVPAAP